MYNYPYGNLQELNLDWVLTEWRNYQAQIEDMIAPQWSESVSYEEDAVVIYEHVLYRCVVTASTPRIFEADEWQSVRLIDIINGGS